MGWFRSVAAQLKDGLCCSQLWTGLVIMLFYQFGGYNVVTFYASTIIAGASSMSDNYQKALVASVAVAVSGLLGVIVGLILVRLEMNRKKILLVSGLGTSVAFIVLSVSFHVDNLVILTD